MRIMAINRYCFRGLGPVSVPCTCEHSERSPKFSMQPCPTALLPKEYPDGFPWDWKGAGLGAVGPMLSRGGEREGKGKIQASS